MHDYKIVNKDELLTNRSKLIGSADIAILAGYGKRFNKTPHSLWLEKTGRATEQISSEALYWGTVLEDKIAARYIEDHRPDTGLFRTEFEHPDYSFAIAHPDLICTKSGAAWIVEIKTAGIAGAARRNDPDYGYSQTDRTEAGIPASVYCQVQWQLLCTDLQSAIVAVLINTSDYREYGIIFRNEKLIEKLLSLAERFYWHIQTDTEPTPETWQDVKRIYQSVTPYQCMIGGDTAAMAWSLKEKSDKISLAIKRLEEKKDECRNALALLIGENGELIDDNGEKICSQYLVNRETVSVPELKKNNWLYSRVKKYIKKSQSRILRF
jgi:putative phage-type endonuclease